MTVTELVQALTRLEVEGKGDYYVWLTESHCGREEICVSDENQSVELVG